VSQFVTKCNYSFLSCTEHNRRFISELFEMLGYKHSGIQVPAAKAVQFAHKQRNAAILTLNFDQIRS
jgi:hypothetical protein